MGHVSRRFRFSLGVALLTLMSMSAGCTSTIVKDAVNMVGDEVIADKAAKHTAELAGQPASAADATFGAPREVLVNEATGDQLRLYAVKNDVLKKLEWAVRCRDGLVVRVAMINSDPDGSRDIVTKLAMDKSYQGQTAAQVESGKYLTTPIAVFRSQDASTVRVYDVSNIIEFMGAPYCALRFDPQGIFENARVFGRIAGK
jgi:hypothetical protein